MAVGGTPTGVLDDLKDEFLNCKVCTKPYTMKERRPKELPCRHTYCMSCIDQLIPQRGQLHCPYCRTPFDLNDGGAETLQDALTIKQFMDFLKVSRSEPTEGITTCEECSRDQRSVSWCYHCRRQICGKCEECHSKMRSFAGHSVESLNIVNLTDARKVFYCEHHKQEKLQKFCELCQEVICLRCTLTSHQEDNGHKVVDLESIQEKHLTILNEIVDDVMSIQQKAILKSFIASRKTDMLDKNYRSCIVDMDSFFKKLRLTLEETINTQEKKLKEFANTFKLSSIDQFKKETEEAEIFLSHIGSTVETFQPILDRQCPVEVARTLHDHSRSLKDLVTDGCKSLPDTEKAAGPTSNIAYSLLSFTHSTCNDLAAFITENTAIGAFNVVPAHTKVSVENGVVGVPCSFFIKLHDRNKEPCSQTSKNIKIEAAVYLDNESMSIIFCQVQPTNPGEYEVQFVPHASGYHKVVVKVMGESVFSPVISVGKFCMKILQDKLQNTVHANVMKVNTDNCVLLSSDLQDVSVQCLDPRSEIVEPVEYHVAKGIVEAKFVLRSFGKHLVRAMYRDIPIISDEDMSVYKKLQQIGQGEKGLGNLQNITDLVVLPSGTILVLDLQTKRGKCKCRLSTWYSGSSGISWTGTTYTSIETSQYRRPSLAVGYSSESNVCICSNNETGVFLTFYTPSLQLKGEGVKLENVKQIAIAIAINSEGIILMCSSQSNIRAFLPDGTLSSIIEHDESNEFEIKTPVDICVDPTNNVFICDSGNKCVHMLNSNHVFVKTFREDCGINKPIAIAVNSSGTLFILEKQNILVIRIDDGQVIDTIEWSSRGDDKIVCTKDDYIIITNKSKSNLIKFSYCNTNVDACSD